MDSVDAIESDRRSAKRRYQDAYAVADAKAMAAAMDDLNDLGKKLKEELGRKQAA